MKTHLCIFFMLCLVVSSLYAGAKKEVSQERLQEVVVYAYDSFVADWGPAPEIEKRFEEQTGYACEIISVGDAAQVMSRAVAEKNAPVADVLIGIDNNQVAQAKTLDILTPYKPVDADDIIASDIMLDEDWFCTPYDWSHFAIIYDTQSHIPAPQSLEDLTNPIYKQKLILTDARTSTPGLGFVAWTIGAYGEDYLDFWRRLKPSILTIAPGWDSGYALFTAGEAPLVLSYTTSPAYHVEYDNTDRYEALVFPEGHIMQIEGAGLVK
ncbi:MAG: thiamine ABC transporter substrate-binding protein, partial [Spirochaetales bacterium]